MAAIPAPQPLPVSPRVVPVGTKDRIFYGAMAIALAITVFAGFAPTYYGHLVRSRPMLTFSGNPFTGLIHVHGLLFTAWVILFVAQTALVSAHRVAIHRRVGVAGAVLAAAKDMQGGEA